MDSSRSLPAGRRATAPPRLRTLVALACAVALVAVAAVSAPAGAGAPIPPLPAAPAEPTPKPPGPRPTPGLLTSNGRWLLDSAGRVRLLTGINMVAKDRAPAHVLYTPAQLGFGADDARFLAEQGFDVVRLGILPRAVMPQPGRIDRVYLQSFRSTIRQLAREGILVLVDLHQDQFNNSVCGGGFPDWMTLTHGKPNQCLGFPLDYALNPATAQSFQSLWDNEPVAGKGLQEHLADIWSAVADVVAEEPNLLGYDLLNEPWSGNDWVSCFSAAGCPALDRSGLDVLHARLVRAIRARDRVHLIFGEPYSTFNSGPPTSIRRPGDDPRAGMAFHLYADPSRNDTVVANAVDWSARRGGPILAGEFGATDDGATISTLVGVLDRGLVPWLFWTYDENLIVDPHQPPTAGNIRAGVLDGLVRPHAVAVAGTPTLQTLDPATRVFRTSWTTVAPGGRRVVASSPTEIAVPASDYPDGYRVEVVGGRLTSAPGAAVLTVANEPGASTVTVTVRPA